MNISNNIWWTRRSHIESETRLISYANHAQILLLWYSFSSVASSIYYIRFEPNNEYSNITWIIYSVFLLVISGFVKTLDLKSRANLFKDSYEKLGYVYRKSKTESEVNENLEREYASILATCENHLQIDFYSALCKAHLTEKKDKLDRHPTKYIWCVFIVSRLKRTTILSLLYSIPVLIFYLIRLLA